jgi:hypothetical protein
MNRLLQIIIFIGMNPPVSISMLITSFPSIIHLVLSLISFIAIAIGILISFGILFASILLKYTFPHIYLTLCANSHLLVYFFDIFEFIYRIPVLEDDFNLSVDVRESFSCRTPPYIGFSLTFSVYIQYILQRECSQSSKKEYRSLHRIFVE